MTDFFLLFSKLTLINPMSGINGLAALNNRVSIQLDMISIPNLRSSRDIDVN